MNKQNIYFILSIILFILAVISLIKGYRNIDLLNSDPCKLCQDLGYSCLNLK